MCQREDDSLVESAVYMPISGKDDWDEARREVWDRRIVLARKIRCRIPEFDPEEN